MVTPRTKKGGQEVFRGDVSLGSHIEQRGATKMF